MGRLNVLQGVAVLCGVLKRKTVFRLIFVLSKKNLKKKFKKNIFFVDNRKFQCYNRISAKTDKQHRSLKDLFVLFKGICA